MNYLSLVKIENEIPKKMKLYDLFFVSNLIVRFYWKVKIIEVFMHSNINNEVDD